MIKYLALATVLACADPSCEGSGTPVSSSGVRKTQVTLATGSDGLTTEQRNVADRLKQDNQPGSIKHLYVISAYSGQTLIYSTVRGKVSSSGKRLTPSSVVVNREARPDCIDVVIGGVTYCTAEVLQDDGVYGSSGEYLYWFDTKGIYHQHFVQGGQILHVASEPIAVKSVVINMETNVHEPSEALAAPTKAAK